MTAPVASKAVLTCRSKKRYSDEFAARACASLTCEHWNLPAAGVYHCPECKGWHITTNKKERRARVTATELVMKPDYRRRGK